MQTQNQTTAAVSSTNAAAVVQNDNNIAAAAAHAANYKRIEQLIVEREVWEQGVFRTTNEQLYALLAKCFALYNEMCGATDSAKDLSSALKAVIAMKGHNFNKGTHTITKIVKCVFGVDRRRVSAYSLVLREALTQKLKAEDIAAFIANGGGVEEIRRSKSATAKTPAQKAELGKAAVGGEQLAVVSGVKLAEKIDVANVGNDLVAIVTQQADGSLIVRALVHSQTVLNAALACAYSASKVVVENDNANKAAANDDKALDVAIKAAAAA
jgi:hypothetical protein